MYAIRSYYEVESVQAFGEDQAEQHQADRGAERIGDQAAESLVNEGGGNAEYRFGAEPGGEDHGQDNGKWQVAAGDDVVAGIVHPSRGIKADADGNGEIDDDEPDQHRNNFV